MIKNKCENIGLELNFSKCEFFTFGSKRDATAAQEKIVVIHFSIKILLVNELSLLGFRLQSDLIPNAISDKINVLSIMQTRLYFLSAHHAFFC